jgi:hypothetical protein
MAYYDHTEAQRKLKMKETYDALKKHLGSLDENKKTNEFMLALPHIYNMEHDMKEMKEELDRYRSFFKTLSTLMPKEFSIHDRIG